MGHVSCKNGLAAQPQNLNNQPLLSDASLCRKLHSSADENTTTMPSDNFLKVDLILQSFQMFRLGVNKNKGSQYWLYKTNEIKMIVKTQTIPLRKNMAWKHGIFKQLHTHTVRSSQSIEEVI